MQASILNLTRKWRAQSFDTLVGQDLAIKILKNSLYTAHFFPVYLFAGQRGCGKTSTARIFAAALNCVNLEPFRTKPKEIQLPCGVCESCVAMAAFRHPDFIEIDAASHTGVDNMRTIIDAAYYLPVLGRKKIYLIDEAHMLSKAAFNALLKIFEEPPLHAHFILATTDPEKIIETVRSRCFSLFFDAIDASVLAQHLAHLCTQEKIEYADDALLYIAQSAEGSARDAINILETVRFSYPSITKAAVLRVLGHVDDQQLASMLKMVIHGDLKAFLAAWSEGSVQRASAQHMWAGLVRLIRGIVWMRNGVTPHDVPQTLMSDYFAQVSVAQCTRLLDALYNLEPLFIRSSNQRALLEFTLLQLCTRFKKKSDDPSYGQSGVVGVPQPTVDDIDDEVEDENEEDDDEEESDEDEEAAVLTNPQSDDERMSVCKKSFAQLADPLLASVLSQLMRISRQPEDQKLTLHFSAQHAFFADTIMASDALWQPMIRSVYAHEGAIQCLFDGVQESVPATEKKTGAAPVKPAFKEATPVAPAKKQTIQPAHQERKPEQRPYTRRAQVIPEKTIDVSDTQRWPLTNRVLSYFPGTVTVVDEARL